MKKWATTFSWHERVEAFDAHYTMHERLAVERNLQEMAEDMGRREAQLRERALAVREKAMTQAERMLDWPLTTQKALETDEDGIVTTMVFAPANWHKGTAVALFNMALGDGPPEETDPWEEADFSGLSYEELHTFADLYQRIRPKGPGGGS